MGCVLLVLASLTLERENVRSCAKVGEDSDQLVFKVSFVVHKPALSINNKRRFNGLILPNYLDRVTLLTFLGAG